MTKIRLILYILIFGSIVSFGGCMSSYYRQSVVFASYAQNTEQIEHIIIMTESLREFGGIFSDAPVWMYVPTILSQFDDETDKRINVLNIEVKISDAPKDAGHFYYSGKTFASAKAEQEADGSYDILVWLDDDTIILQEPSEFLIPENIVFAYRPVMHKLIGSSYDVPPDKFWSHIYNKLDVVQSKMFPMKTVTDNETIRPYFNAGILVVRPEKGILRNWVEYYPKLYSDSIMIEMAETDRYKQIFLHQVVLSCAVLNTVAQDEMLLMSDKINYPIFFKEMFGADEEYADMTDAVTLRYDFYFRDPAPDWDKKLTGDRNKIEWIKKRLGKK